MSNETEWDNKGLPLAGTICEWREDKKEGWTEKFIAVRDVVNGELFIVVRDVHVGALDMPEYRICGNPSPKNFRDLTDPMTPAMKKAQRVYDVAGIRGLFDMGLIADIDQEDES